MHVAFGAGWTVIDLFLGFVIGPILGSLSVPARIEFTTRFMPKMVVLMPAIVTATLVAGWQLSTHLGTNLTSYPQHSWVVASMIVVGVMAIIALGLARARQHRGADRAQEAAPESAGDRAADEALHLRGRDHRPDADRDVRDHDQARRELTSWTRRQIPTRDPDRDGVDGADHRRRDLSVGPPARARAIGSGGDPAGALGIADGVQPVLDHAGEGLRVGADSSMSPDGHCSPTW